MRKALVRKFAENIIGHMCKETCLDLRAHYRHGTGQAIEYQGVANTRLDLDGLTDWGN